MRIHLLPEGEGGVLLHNRRQGCEKGTDIAKAALDHERAAGLKTNTLRAMANPVSDMFMHVPPVKIM